MPEIPVVLECTDFEGRVVVFEKTNYDKHKRKHPELEDNTFFPRKVKNALQNPTYTVPGYRNYTLCYYFEEFIINGIIKYTKVVIMDTPRKINGKNTYCIKTTHKVNHIQEAKYQELTIIDHRSTQ